MERATSTVGGPIEGTKFWIKKETVELSPGIGFVLLTGGAV